MIFVGCESFEFVVTMLALFLIWYARAWRSLPVRCITRVIAHNNVIYCFIKCIQMRLGTSVHYQERPHAQVLGTTLVHGSHISNVEVLGTPLVHGLYAIMLNDTYLLSARGLTVPA